VFALVTGYQGEGCCHRPPTDSLPCPLRAPSSDLTSDHVLVIVRGQPSRHLDVPAWSVNPSPLAWAKWHDDSPWPETWCTSPSSRSHPVWQPSWHRSTGSPRTRCETPSNYPADRSEVVGTSTRSTDVGWLWRERAHTGDGSLPCLHQPLTWTCGASGPPGRLLGDRGRGIMADMTDDFAEFDTPPEELLDMLDQGESVTFGVRPRLFVSYSALPGSWPGADQNENPARPANAPIGAAG